jgi:hypothetical protein
MMNIKPKIKIHAGFKTTVGQELSDDCFCLVKDGIIENVGRLDSNSVYYTVFATLSSNSVGEQKPALKTEVFYGKINGPDIEDVIKMVNKIAMRQLKDCVYEIADEVLGDLSSIHKA